MPNAILRTAGTWADSSPRRPPLLDPAVTPGATAALLQELDVADHHRAIHCLAHVVHRKQPDADGGEGLHLHPGPADGLDADREPDRKARFVDCEFRGDAR